MITFLLGAALGFITAVLGFIFVTFTDKEDKENETWYVCVNNYAGFVKGRLYKADKQGKIYDGNGNGVCPGEALARLADSNEIETWKLINHIK